MSVATSTAPRPRTLGTAGAWWVAIPVVAFLALLLVWPVATVLHAAFADGQGGVTTAHFSAFFSLSIMREAFVNSLLVALGSVILASLIAVPLAYLTVRFEFRGAALVQTLGVLPLVMPLLVTALERAMQLAESMEARGFGGQVVPASSRQRTLNQLALLFGLGALGAGFAGIGFWPEQRLLAGALLVAGLALLGWSFWDQGRRVHRSRYHRWVWARPDRIICATSLLSLTIWAGALLLRGEGIFYYPFPPYTPWPAFQPLLGMALVLLAVPAVLLQPAKDERRMTNDETC